MKQPGSSYGSFKTQCAGKLKHGSESAAQYYLDNYHNPSKGAEPSEPYKCKYCKHWHIGRVKPKQNAEKKPN